MRELDDTNNKPSPVDPDRVYFCEDEEEFYERGPDCFLCEGAGFYFVGEDDVPCWRCDGYGHLRRRVERMPGIMGDEYQEVCSNCGRQPKMITYGGYPYSVCAGCGDDANMTWYGSQEWRDEEFGVRDWIEDAEDDDDDF